VKVTKRRIVWLGVSWAEGRMGLGKENVSGTNRLPFVTVREDEES